MFMRSEVVVQESLGGYGASFLEIGRLTAKYAQRILLGANAGSLTSPLSNTGFRPNAAVRRTSTSWVVLVGIHYPESVADRNIE